MTFDKLVFDHGARHFELIEALGCFRTLAGFAQDPAALRTHLMGAGRPRRWLEGGELELLPEQDVDRFLEPVGEDIGTALGAYRRQLLVVVVSIVEAAIADAFEVLFAFRPESMKGLSPEGSEPFKPVVHLDELMSATQLDALRVGVIERAVAYACQGRQKKTVLKRLARLFAIGIDEQVERRFIDLVDRRNAIVHDNSKIELANEDVEGAFDVGLDFVLQLGKLVAASSLPLHDPMNVCHS